MPVAQLLLLHQGEDSERCPWKMQGWQVAQAFAAKGVAAFVLKYRLNQTPADLNEFANPTTPRAGSGPRSGRPKPEEMAARIAPQVADSNDAFALIRSNAEKWHVDPDRIGMIGFSAGAMPMCVG